MTASPVAPTKAIMTILATSSTPQLTKKEIEKLKKFDHCFNCKNKSYIALQCTQTVRFYLAVSAALQEMILVKNANNLKKK